MHPYQLVLCHGVERPFLEKLENEDILSVISSQLQPPTLNAPSISSFEHLGSTIAYFISTAVQKARSAYRSV